jgi:hypothetical protein
VLGAVVRGFQGKDYQNRTRPGRYLARWRVGDGEDRCSRRSIAPGRILREPSGLSAWARFIRIDSRGSKSHPEIGLRSIRPKRAGMPAIPTRWEAPSQGSPTRLQSLQVQGPPRRRQVSWFIRLFDNATTPGKPLAACGHPHSRAGRSADRPPQITQHRTDLVLHQTTTKEKCEATGIKLPVVMSHERRQPSAQLRTRRAGGGFIGTSWQALGALRGPARPSTEGRSMASSATQRCLQQAGGYVAVRLQSSHTGGRGGWRGATVRPHPVAHRPRRTAVGRTSRRTGPGPHGGFRELMAHRAGRACEPGRSAKRAR